MKQIYTFFPRFCLIVAFWLVSCQSGSEIDRTTSSVELIAETVLPQPSPEAVTSLPQQETVTVPASIIDATSSFDVPDPIPSDTDVLETIMPPTLSATPTIAMATLTPLPTLQGEELELAIEGLFTDPMNCDVPCWWGFIPGVANFNEIQHFISPFNFYTSEYKEDGEVVYLLLEVGYIEEKDYSEVRIVYNFSDSILTGITAPSPPISEILTKYGRPDEVWISVMNDLRENQPTMWVNMIYFHGGMGVSYVIDIDIQENLITGCFGDELLSKLRLVVPTSVTDYRDLLVLGEDRHHLPLNEATGMAIEEFIQQFSDPSQPQCIETPTELWE